MNDHLITYLGECPCCCYNHDSKFNRTLHIYKNKYIIKLTCQDHKD